MFTNKIILKILKFTHILYDVLVGLMWGDKCFVGNVLCRNVGYTWSGISYNSYARNQRKLIIYRTILKEIIISVCEKKILNHIVNIHCYRVRFLFISFVIRMCLMCSGIIHPCTSSLAPHFTCLLVRAFSHFLARESVNHWKP